MSYLVLARKYRSDTFDEVVGQEQVARTLKRAIESDRVAHAFLFTGTRGVGKTSMARILAKALNCEKSDRPTPNPCGRCNSCNAIKAGDDMDVIEIDAASNTQVEKVRELIENCRFRPARARFKVYIIDEVHMLSRGAFNALLKTLEEPPAHVKFILATTETEKVPATILSRCQRYDFRNIPTREIAAHLKALCKAEKVKADDDALLLVARAGAGSMRDALSLLDRVLSLGEKTLTAEMIEQLLGLPKAQVIFDLAQAIGEGNTRLVLESADRVIGDGLSPEQLVASLADHLRNLLLLATCGKDSELVEAAGYSLDELAKQAGKFDPISLTQSIAVLDELRRNLRASTAGRAMLDAVLARLTLAEQFTPIADLLSGARPAGANSPAGQKKKPDLIAPAATETAAAQRVVVQTFISPPPAGDDSDDSYTADALPAVGKVYDGPTRSLGAMFAANRARTTSRVNPTLMESADSNLSPVDQGEFSGVMARLREALRRHGAGFDGILVHGQIASLEGGQAVIRFGHDHQAAAIMLDRNGKRETVQSVLGELLNQPIGLRIEVDDEPDAPAAPTAAPAARRPAMPADRPACGDQPLPAPSAPVITAEQKQQILATDPLVRAAVELFDGDIVKAE